MARELGLANSADGYSRNDKDLADITPKLMQAKIQDIPKDKKSVLQGRNTENK